MAKYLSKVVEIAARQIAEAKAIRDLSNDYLVKFVDQPDPDDQYVIESAQCGTHVPVPGDYIIFGANGDTYLCPRDVFEVKYEPAD